MIHHKCRQGVYPGSRVERFEVPEGKVSWKVEYPEYKPVEYTSGALRGKPWADPEIGEESFEPRWNALDGGVDRRSHVEEYAVRADGYPVNPVGRTGLLGRGLLGRWGPNHAADPIVSRWKRNGTGALEIHRGTEKPILQFVAIERRDSAEWALPGGMVDPGETLSAALRREFMEEALDVLGKGSEERRELECRTREFFDAGEEIYRGYVDDPRNTDNAWMETVALNFHDEDGGVVGRLTLKAGDDARNVKWMDIDGKLNLYANHAELIKKTVQKRDAHW
ncbi:hypothetical protein KM043_003826 [Ampulex compressa]|nr:hypothetical protein KM043_003826 [Ampulex compressa]